MSASQARADDIRKLDQAWKEIETAVRSLGDHATQRRLPMFTCQAFKKGLPQ